MKAGNLAAAGLVLAAGLALTACGTQPRHFVPAADAGRQAVNPDIARAQTDNTVMEAEFGAWDASPAGLDREVTPVLVTLENRGDAPLMVRYQQFALQSEGGDTYLPMPPYDIQGEVRGRRIDPYYGWRDFRLAPHMGRYYVDGWGLYDSWYGYDPFYYDRFYPRFERVGLPTSDMLRRALPEGVLEPGGRVSGFLYFERLSGDVERLTLRVQLGEVQEQRPVTTFSIPFVREGGT